MVTERLLFVSLLFSTAVCLQKLKPLRLSVTHEGGIYRYSITYQGPSVAYTYWKNFYFAEDFILIPGENFHDGQGESYVTSPRPMEALGVMISLPYSNTVYTFRFDRADGVVDLSYTDVHSVQGHDIVYTPGLPKNITLRIPHRPEEPEPELLWGFLYINNEVEHPRLEFTSAYDRRIQSSIGQPITTLHNDIYESSVLLNLTSYTGILAIMLPTFYPRASTVIELYNIIQDGQQGPFPANFLSILLVNDIGRGHDDIIRCNHGDICDLTGAAIGSDVVALELTKIGSSDLQLGGFRFPTQWFYVLEYQIRSFRPEDEGEYRWRATTKDNRVVDRVFRLTTYDDLPNDWY